MAFGTSIGGSRPFLPCNSHGGPNRTVLDVHGESMDYLHARLPRDEDGTTGAAPRDAVMTAAYSCADEADFRRRLGNPERQVRGRCVTTVAVCVLLAAAARQAGAQDGLYAGIAAGWDRAAGNYTKSVALDVPPATYRASSDSASGGFGALRASFGYRAFVAGRAYVSAEFETALHTGDGAAGFLREGTGLGDRDVWPGPWTLQKNRSLGVNARLGYGPGAGLLGEGGSVYLVTGLHRLKATVGRGFDDGVVSRINDHDHTLRPWLLGAGLEWGSRSNRIGVEIRHAAADLNFRTAGDGSAIGKPRIDHAFDVREWGVQVGYTRSF